MCPACLNAGRHVVHDGDEQHEEPLGHLALHLHPVVNVRHGRREQVLLDDLVGQVRQELLQQAPFRVLGQRLQLHHDHSQVLDHVLYVLKNVK